MTNDDTGERGANVVPCRLPIVLVADRVAAERRSTRELNCTRIGSSVGRN